MNSQTAIERTVTGLDYELVDVERSAAGLLRIFIDRIAGHAYAEGDSTAVNVDDCERVTRQLQYVLEVEGVAYERLEVSSPGLDRPLKKPADYERFAGHEVNVTLKAPFKGRKNFRGLLMRGLPGQGSDSWRLALSGDKSEQSLDFTLDEVREARLVPVLDFKGRKQIMSGTPQAAAAQQRVDGGQSR
jgi:ribosome maturation factor RimP